MLPATSNEYTSDAAALLTENNGWVLEKHAKYERFRQQAPNRQFEADESFLYLGEPHEVAIERRSFSAVSGGMVRLARHHVEQTSVKQALRSLYRREAKERFEDRAGHFAARMGVEYDEIQIRNQRTMWGSCSTTGTLGLNWRLMMAPPEIIDYVVIHELAHLREPNHTNAFWSIVADHDSNYQDHSAWLDENSAQLVFSDEDL